MRLLDSGHNLHFSVTHERLATLPNEVFGIRDLCYFKAGIRDLKAK